MNFDWQRKLKRGQVATGFIEIFETNSKNVNIRAIINYFPQFDQFDKNKICSVIVFYECSKIEISDGFFHWINDDIIDLIKENESEYYSKDLNNFEFMMLQNYLCKKLPEIEYFSHGDYSAIES